MHGYAGAPREGDLEKPVFLFVHALLPHFGQAAEDPVAGCGNRTAAYVPARMPNGAEPVTAFASAMRGIIGVIAQKDA